MFQYALRAYQIISEGHYVRLAFRDRHVIACSVDEALTVAFDGPAVVDLPHFTVFPGDGILYIAEIWRGIQYVGVCLN